MINPLNIKDMDSFYIKDEIRSQRAHYVCLKVNGGQCLPCQLRNEVIRQDWFGLQE